MGFLDRLFGRGQSQGYGPQYGGPQYGGLQYGRSQDGRPQDRRLSPDEQAIRRYQYLLQTAPPEKIEQAHAEAFAQLTQAQRQQVLQQLASVDSTERPQDASPGGLARYATRLEMRRPGTLFGSLGGPGMAGRGGMGGVGGMGMGSVLLTSVAGAFVGSAIASEMFDNDGFMDWDTDGDAGEGMGGEQLADGGDSGGVGGYDSAGYADGGGDLGGGDFGGGDFGGGDFGGF